MALSYLQSVGSTSNAAAYTFSAQNLGAAAADRYIICAVNGSGGATGRTISSVTIGGVNASIIVQKENTTVYNVSGIVIAAVPNGATGDVVVTLSDNWARCHIALWRVTGLSSATAIDNGNSVASDPTYDIDIPAKGIAIGTAMTDASTSCAWTGVTEKYDETVESKSVTGASDTFTTEQTNLTLKADFSSPSNSCGVFASFRMVQTYQSTITGTLQFSGELIKKAQKLTGLAGTLQFAGALVKKSQKILAGTLQFVGTLSNFVVHKLLQGTLNFTGALVKKVKFNLAGVLQFLGIQGYTFRMTIEGNLSFSGGLVKKVSKILTGTLTMAGTLSAVKYVRYKITSISIKCGTAIVDKLKLRRIK